jgi:hypothetical protein
MQKELPPNFRIGFSTDKHFLIISGLQLPTNNGK